MMKRSTCQILQSVKSILKISSLFIFTIFSAINLQAQCDVASGVISTPSNTTLCVGDGNADLVDVDLNGNTGTSGWVITDIDGIILGVPAAPPFDFDGAGLGTCLIWHVSYDGPLSGMSMGERIALMEGCFDLSNPIPVFRTVADGGSIATTDGDTEITICAGDGVSDAFDVVVTGGEGESSGWIITDDNLNILALPQNPPFDLEGAGPGTCLVWYVRYNGDLTGVEVGANAADIEGCFDLSNPITVIRNGVDGGSIATTEGETELTICAGDGVSDASDVVVTGGEGDNSGWVITDDNLNILALPSSPPFDLEGAGGGTCLVWYIRHNGDLMGAEVGLNAGDLEGCYDLSNPITVIRYGVDGGSIATPDGETELTICAGDGVSDAFDVIVTGGEGDNSGWVITDDNLNILALPSSPPFDLEGAGAGTCLVWYLRHNGDLMGAEVGLNAADLSGCYDLSNPITVIRNIADGGSITTTDGETELTICAGDGVSDAFDVVVTGGEGQNSGWVITDDNLNILALPSSPPFDLEGAGGGTCLVWYIRHNGDLMGAEVGLNAGDLEGCYDLSNPITVIRQGVDGGSIATPDGETELTICAGDGISDAFDVVVTGGEGDNSGWVITDDNLNILALPSNPPFDLEGVGGGTCLVWYIRHNGDLMGAEVGLNAGDLEGCYDLSNPITVIRHGVDGGSIATPDGETELTICAGDGISDAFDVVVTGGEGENSGWVITDDNLNILALPSNPPFDLEGAGGGTCLVWYVRHNGDLMGAEVGMNAGDLEGCYDLSNPITVIRHGVDGGSIATPEGETELTICAGDGISDAFDVVVTGGEGDNSGWVITDDNLNILALPSSPPFDLEGAGEGTCLVWYIRYNGELMGAEVGLNAGDLDGCFDLSNPITVVRLTGDACQLPCAAPMQFDVTNLNGNRVLVDWNSVPDAFFYYVRYREVGTNNWRYRFAFDSQRILTGVRSDRNYEYQVITYCFTDGFSSWSDVQFINAARSARSAISNEKVLEIESSLVPEQKDDELLLYPNPVQDVLNIQHTFNAEEVQLKIYSVEGKLIMDEAKKGFETLQVSTSRLEKGQYILIITDGENVLNKMFIKQ